ncbi:kinase-like domain-containing protein [Scenedesmus sp. NREL 46B-D3]|nr:kinase-like domain-containing protein [Scenedesmus sp. NREL 46B-D3]
MLPHDVCSAVGSSTGNASRSLAAPRAFHFLQQTSHARTPLRHAQLHSQQLGVASASGSAPRPIPARGGRLGATATVEAPVNAPSTSAPIVDFGYDHDIESKYEWGRQLGKGGNGVVREVKCMASGEQYACKAIGKVLEGDFSDKKKAGHVESIRREVEVLRRLSGSLNIVKLVDVFEDEQNVYVVQELCKGGELWHRIGEAHYSERTVASFMRAVLRTIAQCHSHHILHRDIKPGNFMLLDHSDRSALKAIDFGLAAPFDPEDLPRKDLGLEGTPWYMAPEMLSSQVVPASDVWSAGVMAHQLLTGRLPFDDHRNPYAPSISAVWRSVLTDKVDFNMPWWAGISDEGKDFVHMLLNRDPAKRPSAKEALKHPWLQGNSSERSVGKQIDVSVVARIQRFAQNNRFKRSVLRLIAEELLSRPGALAADMQLSNTDAIDREAAAVALSQMGYKLDPTEVGRLLEQVDTSNSGKVRRAALAASQIDWRYLQQNQMSDWLDIARRAFASLDKDGDGCLCMGDIMASLRAKLPPDELRLTIQQAMAEAGHAGEWRGLDAVRVWVASRREEGATGSGHVLLLYWRLRGKRLCACS